MIDTRLLDIRGAVVDAIIDVLTMVWGKGNVWLCMLFAESRCPACTRSMYCLVIRNLLQPIIALSVANSMKIVILLRIRIEADGRRSEGIQVEFEHHFSEYSNFLDVNSFNHDDSEGIRPRGHDNFRPWRMQG